MSEETGQKQDIPALVLETARAQRRREDQRRRRRRTRIQLAALAAVAATVIGAVLVIALASGHTHQKERLAASQQGLGSPGLGSRSPRTPVSHFNPDARITIDAVGDTMLGTPQFGLPPDNGRDLLAATAQYLKAEVSIVDQEGTFTTAGSSKCVAGSTECYAFTTPPGYAADLSAAGFNVANLASNHTFDAGAAGLTDTVDALTRAHLAHTGLPGQYATLHVGNVKVAVLGFAPYPWCADSLDLPAVSALVRQASRQANLVIVYFHAGAQGEDEIHVGPGAETVFGDPQGDIRVLAHTFVDAGADMVIGTGPHVLRGIEFYKGKMIDYSLGNFLGYRGFGLGGNLSTSAVLQATITASGRFVSARLRPVELDGDGVPSPGGGGVALVQRVSEEDFGSSAGRVSSAGVITPPEA